MSVKVLVCGVMMASSLMLPAIAQAAMQGMLAIEGTATYRERIALPPDAIFEATLEDTTRTEPAPVLGQTRIEQPGDPPFHFTIKYDPTQIQPTTCTPCTAASLQTDACCSRRNRQTKY